MVKDVVGMVYRAKYKFYTLEVQDKMNAIATTKQRDQSYIHEGLRYWLAKTLTSKTTL